MEKNYKYLKFYQVISLIIVALVINFTLSAYFMTSLKDIFNAYSLYFIALFNSISFGFVIFLGIKIINIKFIAIFPIKHISLNLIFSIAITCLGCVIIVSEVDNIFQYFFPMDEEIFKLFYNLLNSNDIFGSILALSIIAPITEELFFRGLIFKSFTKNHSLIYSTIISSLLFGMIHLNPWQLLGAFVVGNYLAWIYHRTKNIIAPILAHSIFNGIPLLISKISPEEIEGLTKKTKPFSMQPLWLDLSGIILIIIGLVFANAIINKAIKSGS